MFWARGFGGAKFHHSTPKHNYITIYINASSGHTWLISDEMGFRSTSVAYTKENGDFREILKLS